MTTIDVVTVLPKHLGLSLRILPNPCSMAFLQTCPGNLYVGHWDRAGHLTLFLPDGAKCEAACANVDDTAYLAGFAWNTLAGRARIERHITEHGGAPVLDWGYHEASHTVENVIDSVCGNGAPLERVTQAAFNAAIGKLAEVHGERGAHKIVMQ